MSIIEQLNKPLQQPYKNIFNILQWLILIVIGAYTYIG